MPLEPIFTIGRRFEDMQREAMRLSHSSNPTGIRYNQAHARLMSTCDLARINKTDRMQYLWCWQHREAIEKWWSTLAPDQRARWTHPATVQHHYHRACGIEQPTAAQRRRSLQDALDEANARIADLDAGSNLHYSTRIREMMVAEGISRRTAFRRLTKKVASSGDVL